MKAPATRAVVDALTADSAEVRFVGGCVRDAVAGRKVTDVDIATPDPPETVTRLLEAAGIRVVPTGIAHGTVTAVIRHRHFEITTLRRDVETYGRRAKVAFTDDWTADAARRDFTINALFCDPDGTLYDPFGGIDDLDAGRVRFVGDAVKRIKEDVLRLLRFFRFYAHYGRPPPDAEALAACRAMARALPGLSGERVSAELLRLLAAPDPAAVLALMIEAEVLAFVLPEVAGLDAL
ncbi:MAG: CCA tRNA nucleotidyltransferase, partial [Alphaproteobacteria bacterium]